jgi:glycosyltransferase involved in cell wall biosynthesis
MDVSIVIPLFNEEESITELTSWIQRVVNENRYSYEIIMVDDGSTDNSWTIIEALNARNPAIRGIKFRRNYGKSAALNVAFECAQGDVVITMDADLQDSPDEIPGYIT